MVPSAGPPPTEAQVRAMLVDYLRAEFPHDRKAQAEGLALFDNPDLIAKIPNPSLWAGLIGLMGTAGESAIDYVLNAKTDAGLPKVALIDFDSAPYPPSDDRIARALLNPETEQQAFVFNPNYQSESPFRFSWVLTHETLHHDLPVSGMEEVIGRALDIYIYLEQLVHHPELALLEWS